jgi:lambda repressor-like predicted transcriptional regulator
MRIDQQVYSAIAYRGTSLAAVARQIGMSKQNLQKKLERNTLKKEELCEIAKILGGQYLSYFYFSKDAMIGDIKRNVS